MAVAASSAKTLTLPPGKPWELGTETKSSASFNLCTVHPAKNQSWPGDFSFF
jgi:hypothetical protein